MVKSDVVRTDLEYITSALVEDLSLMSGKTLLLTGGAGFLGYYLVQTVLHWNQTRRESNAIKLIVLDNFRRGVPPWLKALDRDTHLSLIEHDISKPLPPGISSIQFIIHAASVASPSFYRLYPIETMDANVIGLRILLDYCLHQELNKKPIEGFLFFSSSEIYGDPSPENIPTPETYRGFVSCTGPRACYDESKRYGETLCVNFARQYHLPVKIARPFNNYGPGLNVEDRRVLPDFARDVLLGRDLKVFSDGSPRRTFCYVADAVVGYYKILLKGRPGEAYNIGVEEPEISISGLAARVVDLARQLFGYQGKVVHEASSDPSYLVDNPVRRCPSISKAKTELSYNPTIDLEEGLSRSLSWYFSNR
jgi:UDP-glucuronate decarboxylase